MSTFRLVLDPDSLERRDARPTTGVVYVELHGKPFPERGWSDFAFEFLKAYYDAVLKLRKGGRSSVHFFEGPYELSFTRSGDEVEIRALDEVREVARCKLPYTQLLKLSMRAILPWIEHEQAVSA